MRVAFYIFVGYACLGFLYVPGIESFTALTFITVSCAPLLLSGSLGDGREGGILKVPSAPVYWSVVALGILNLAVIATRVGQPPSDLLSVQGLVRVAALSTTQRYELQGASGNPFLLALSLWLVFRIGATVDRVPKVMQAIGFLPLVFYTLVSTEKWPLFLAGVFFFAGLLLAFPPEYALRTAFRYLALATPFVMLTAGLSLVLRGNPGQVFGLVATLLHYVLAPYHAFGVWLIHEYSNVCCTLGSLSFVGPLDALGLATREAGVFNRNVRVYGQWTNIYTAFRYLVQDFSLVGPFLISCWLVVVHAGLRTLGSTALARQWAGFVIFTALMSVTVTPFVYNSVALAVFLSLASTLSVSVRLPRQNVNHPGLTGDSIT